MYNNTILPMQGGKSALDLARQNGMVEAVKILEAPSKVSEDLYACIYIHVWDERNSSNACVC
jgi:hypothetical protein